jgi:kynurenine 3-monooxygenase
MALENYLEMRDRVDDDDYLLQRALERRLAERHPDRFVPRYAMVTFRRLPYATAFERGQVQRQLLVELTRGHASLDTLDWDVVDAAVRERLAPLPAEA